MHRSPRARRIGFAVGIVLFVLFSIRFLFYLHLIWSRSFTTLNLEIKTGAVSKCKS